MGKGGSTEKNFLCSSSNCSHTLKSRDFSLLLSAQNSLSPHSGPRGDVDDDVEPRIPSPRAKTKTLNKSHDTRFVFTAVAKPVWHEQAKQSKRGESVSLVYYSYARWDASFFLRGGGEASEAKLDGKWDGNGRALTVALRA